MRFIQIIFASTLSFLLSACGSDSSTDSTAPAITQSLWQVDQSTGAIVVVVKNDSIEHYRYYNPYACHGSILRHNLTSIDGNSFTTDDAIATEYSINGDTLTLNNSVALQRSQLSEQDLISCEDNSLTDNLEIQISFNALPDTITITDTQSNDWSADFTLSIWFDIDGSDSDSDGDLFIITESIVRADDDSSELSLNELSASLNHYEQSNDLGRNIARLTASKQGNTIAISIPRSYHKSLANITSSTNLYIQSNASSPDSGHQSDRFPDLNWAAIANLANTLDSSDDISGSASGNQIITDLTDISIQITQ